MSAQDENTPSSASLIAYARRGSQSARAELYRRYSGALSGFLGRSVGRRVARMVSVSDLAQESFVRSLGALDTLPEDAGLPEFERMLYRNARWVVGNQVRKNQRYAGESAAEDSPPHDLPDKPGEHSSGTVTRTDDRRWLAAQVERLKEDQAHVFRLRLEGLEFDEIARELDITERAVRRRYLRGAMELKRFAEGRLGDEGGTPPLP